MSIRARILPKYPVRLQGDGSITVVKENGVVTIGFDYENSEFGQELQDAIVSAQAAATDSAEFAAFATGAALDAEAARDAAEGFAADAAIFSRGVYPSRAVAAADQIDIAINAVFVLGYAAPGDGGHQVYKRVGANPGHAASFQDALGAWFENAEQVLDAKMLGVLDETGLVDETTAMVAWWRAMEILGRPGRIKGRHLVREGELRWPFRGATPHTESIPGPIITTAPGTTFIFAGVADAPLIDISSDPGAGVATAKTGNTTSGSPIITGIGTTAGLVVGSLVYGTGIPITSPANKGDRTRILSIDSGTQITIDAPATATVPGAAFTCVNQGSSDGRYVIGGEIGDIIFEDPSNVVATNRHAVRMSGTQAIALGYMATKSLNVGLNADMIHLWNRTANKDGLNGDTYHVYDCPFRGAQTGTGHKGWTFNNDTPNQTFNGSEIGALFNIAGKKGVLRGIGANTLVREISTGLCEDWAVDLDTNSGSARSIILLLELDAPKNGIRVRRETNVTIMKCRITHRYQMTGTTMASDPVAWPNTGVKIGGLPNVQTQNVEADIIWRVTASGGAAAGVVPNVGVMNPFIDFSDDLNIEQVRIRNNVSTNLVAPPEGPIPNSYFAHNLHSSTRGVQIYRADALIADTSRRHQAVARIAAGGLIANTGYPLTSRVPYSQETLDENGDYDPALFEYTIPYSGSYRIGALFRLTGLVAGNLVRAAIMVTPVGGGAAIRVGEMFHYAAGAGAQTYGVNAEAKFTTGDKIWISAVQPSGAPLAVTDGGDQAVNRLTVSPA